jgi:hypothetical protein
MAGCVFFKTPPRRCGRKPSPRPVIRLVAERIDGPRDAVVVGRESENGSRCRCGGEDRLPGLGVDAPVAAAIIP